jgi:hypothetical protein
MRCALSNVVIVAATLSCSVVSVAQTTTAPIPPAPVPLPLKLLSAGDPDRARVLKYNIENGTRLRCRIDAKFTETPTASAAADRPAVRRQRWVMECGFSSMDDGASRVIVQVIEFKPLDADGKELTDSISKLGSALYSHATADFLLSARGELSAIAVGKHPQPDRTELLMLPLSVLFVPLPAEPLGNKSSWTAPSISFADPAEEPPPVDGRAEDIETFELLSKPEELSISRERPHAAVPEAIRIAVRHQDTTVAYSSVVRLKPDTLQPIGAVMEREMNFGDSAVPLGITKSVQVWNIAVEKGKAPPKEEPEPSSHTLPEPTIRVLDAGLEPRVMLTPRPVVGDWSEYELASKHGKRMAANAEDPVEFKPLITTHFRLTVVKADDAWATCDAEIQSASIAEDGVLTEAQRAATRQQLAKFIGKHAEVKVPLASTNPVVEVKGEGAELLKSLEHARVATPSQSVGVNAEWQSARRKNLQSSLPVAMGSQTPRSK